MADDDSEYRVEKPICCSVQTFCWSNAIWALLSAAIVSVGVVGIVINEGPLVVLPPQAYIVLVAFGGFGVIVICCGVFGLKTRVELCFLIYILLVALGLIAQTLAYCFLLLYANDVGTIASLDDAAINAQDVFEQNLADFAVADQERWVRTQDELRCCGIDFEAGVDDLSIPENDPPKINSGEKCAEQQDTLDTLLQQFDADLKDNNVCNQCDQDGNFGPALDDPFIGIEQPFFCKSKISITIQENTIYIGIALGFLVLIQLIALVSASRMYWVPEFLGGWQFDDEEREVVAKLKHLDLPKNADDYGGNRALSNIRAQASRMSFRFKNAMTPNPEVGRDQGFIKRLSNRRFGPGGPMSMDRTTGFQGVRASDPRGFSNNRGGGGFGQPNPNDNPNNRGFSFKRMSANLFSFGKKGYVDMNPPPGMSSRQTFSPAPPSGPPLPPLPPEPPANNSWRETGKRTSERLKQGLQSLGGAISGGFGGINKPPQPPRPPQESYGNNFSRPPQDSFASRPPQDSYSSMGMTRQPSRNGFDSFKPPPPVPSMRPAPPPPSASFGQSSSGGAFGQPPSRAPMPSFGNAPAMPPSMPQSRPPLASGVGSFGGPSSGRSRPELPSMNNSSAGGMRGGAISGRSNNSSFNKSKSSGMFGRKKSKAPVAPSGGGGAAGGLLAQIQGGARLKPTITNDRSAPKI